MAGNKEKKYILAPQVVENFGNSSLTRNRIRWVLNWQKRIFFDPRLPDLNGFRMVLIPHDAVFFPEVFTSDVMVASGPIKECPLARNCIYLVSQPSHSQADGSQFQKLFTL